MKNIFISSQIPFVKIKNTNLMINPVKPYGFASTLYW